MRRVTKVTLAILEFAFMASWIIPAARESQILCMRLLLHMSAKTIVRGQPPDCVIYIVPNVIFSDECRAELLRRAGISPDDYFRAMAVRGDIAVRTPVEMWRGHPLIECAAALALERLPLTLPSAEDAPKRSAETHRR